MAEKEEKKPEAEQGPQELQEVKATPVEERGAGDVERTRGERFVAPDVDIHERDDSLVLVADVPGVGADGVEVRLENGVLGLTAHRGPEKARDEEAPEADYAEYRPVSYYRAFSLSEDLDAEKITATLKHGVLTVTLPKSARAKPRKIEVKAG